MEQRQMRKARLLAFLWLLVAAAAIVAVTYAWFSFHASTNVEPMTSTISQGEVSLLISNQRDGEFDISCLLTPDSNPETLSPVSTADLSGFYVSSAQSPSGISLGYKEVTDSISDRIIHGTVYLKSENGSCNVYFYRSGMNFGSDTQALASLRLGLKITAESGTNTYIFSLDEMGNTGSAQSTLTVPNSNQVVSSISSGGKADYVKDPALSFSDYFAGESQSGDEKPSAGNSFLTTLAEDEVASVEYWLYLEGCDSNCINAVWNRDFSLQLAFAGTPVQ